MNHYATIDQDQEELLPPHNIEAEQALLGAIFINNEAFGLVETFLDPEHFYEPTHRDIYRAASSLIRADKRADPITLKTFFEGVEVVDGLSIQQYLARLTGAATTVVNAKEYGEAVYDLAVLRETILVCQEATETAYHADVEVEPGKIVEQTVERLENVISAKSGHHKVESGWIAGLADQLISGLDNQNSVGIPTGLKELDRLIGGFNREDVIIIAGRPSMGKTTLAGCLARNIAMAGYGVGFVSLEQSRLQLMARMISDMAYSRDHPVTYQQIIRKSLNMYERDRVESVQEDFKDLPIDVIKSTDMSVAQLRSIMRQKKRVFERRGKTLDVLFVDYIGQMDAGKRYYGNKNNELGEISKGLKGIANDFNVPVVALSQLSRAVENRDNKRPLLSDLRDSGNIEQDADVVLFPFRKHKYIEQRLAGKNDLSEEDTDLLERTKYEMEIIVAKQRNGMTGSANVRADMGAAAIRDF